MRILALSLILISTACVSAQTARPTYTKAELQREQAIQKQIAQDARRASSVSRASSTRLQERHIERMKQVAKPVVIAGYNTCIKLGRPANACKYQIVMLKEGPVNAYADGNKIYISPAMVDATKNNDELAFILSHEYAHNVMNHVASTKKNVTAGVAVGTIADLLLKQAGIATGNQLGKLGAQFGKLKYSQGFESEADYVGLYILAATQFDIRKAPDYWRRSSIKNPNAIYSGSTHPTNPSRFIAMQKTIDEIQAKRRSGQPLLPRFKTRT